MVLGFLNVPDLLHASEACQYARKAALVVLGRDVKHLSDRMRHRRILSERIPASIFISSRLHNLQTFGKFVDDCLDHFSDEARLSIQLSCLHLFSWIAKDIPDSVSSRAIKAECGET